MNESEATRFARSLEAGVGKGVIQELNGPFDWVAICDAAVDTPLIPEAQRRSTADMLGRNMRSDSGMFAGLTRLIAAGAKYRLVRVHEVEGQTRALFRLTTATGSVNYHDIVLEKGHGGVVRAIDMHIFLSGELLSETLRKSVLPVVASRNRGMFEKLVGAEGDEMRALPQIEAMTDATKNNKPREVLAAFEKLPPSVKKKKSLLVMRMQAAKILGDSEYVSAIKDLRREFPGDAGVNLLLLDSYVAGKDFRSALSCVDRLDAAIGGDPFLDCLRAGIHMKAGDLASAKKTAEDAARGDPTLSEPYWSLLTISLEEKNPADTLRVMRQLEEKFGIPFGDIAKIPEYAPFLGSAEYREWQKDHMGAADHPEPSRDRNPPTP